MEQSSSRIHALGATFAASAFALLGLVSYQQGPDLSAALAGNVVRMMGLESTIVVQAMPAYGNCYSLDYVPVSCDDPWCGYGACTTPPCYDANYYQTACNHVSCVYGNCTNGGTGTRCGDGVRDVGEECDLGQYNGPYGVSDCSTQCTINRAQSSSSRQSSVRSSSSRQSSVRSSSSRQSSVRSSSSRSSRQSSVRSSSSRSSVRSSARSSQSYGYECLSLDYVPVPCDHEWCGYGPCTNEPCYDKYQQQTSCSHTSCVYGDCR